MSLLEGDAPDIRELELLMLWREFSQASYAASFMGHTALMADEFAAWLASSPRVEELRQDAAMWWQKRGLGLFSWERDLLKDWSEFSMQAGSMEFFLRVGPISAHDFADWLANREPKSRTRLEELDLSVRAYNLLRSRDVRFVDQIDLSRLDDPLGQKVKGEVAEKLRGWRGDDGTAGVPARL